MQHLLTDAGWDGLALDKERVHRLAEKSPQGSILVLDDAGLTKQGKASAGVTRQFTALWAR